MPLNLVSHPTAASAVTDPPWSAEGGFAGPKLRLVRNIVVASSDREERENWGNLLSQLDCCVLTVKDGEEAVRLIQDHRIDLVVAAVSMSRMDGLEVLRKINNRWHKTELILIARGCEETDRIYLKVGKLYGAVATYTQPLNNEKLLSRVRAVLGFDLNAHMER